MKTAYLTYITKKLSSSRKRWVQCHLFYNGGVKVFVEVNVSGAAISTLSRYIDITKVGKDQVHFTYRQKGFSWDVNNKTKQCAVLSSSLWHLFHGSHWERLLCELIRRLYCQPALSGHIGKEIPSPAPQPHLHPSLAIKLGYYHIIHHSIFWLPHSPNPCVCVDPIAHDAQFYIFFLKNTDEKLGS